MKEATSHSFHVDTNVLIVKFYEPDSEELQEYDIAPIPMLDEVMYEDGKRGRSQLIFHLADKKWVSMSLLYDLAEQINHFRPSNKIDWVTSFLDEELNRLATRLSDEDYVNDQTDQEEVEDGYRSHADQSQKVLLTHKYRAGFDAQTITTVKQKVLDELKKRSVA